MVSRLYSLRRIPFLIIIWFLALAAQAQEQDSLTLLSPDGKTVFSCQLNEKGALLYRVFYMGQPVILSSSLGIEGWRDSFVLKRVERKQLDTTWKPVYGERALVKDKCREADFVLWRQNQ